MNRIALIGAGRMAKVHVPALLAAGAHLQIICDVFEDAAKSLAQETGAKFTTSIDEAVSNPHVDAVIIATPSDTHVEYILKAVAAGKAVMCEKPIAPALADAQRCVDELGDKAAHVFLAFNRRFDSGHSTVKRAIEAGEIGALEQLTITSRDPFPPPLDYIPRSGGLFRDMMIHDFDMARWMMAEEPVRLFAQGSSIVDPEIGKLGDIDTAVVTMLTASGKQAVILNSRRAVYGYDQRVEAFGAKGMLLSDNAPRNGVRTFSSDLSGAPEPFRAFFLERYGDSYKTEIETFLDCVAKGIAMPVNALDGLKAAYLAEAATDSLKLGTPVTLNKDCKVTWK